MILAHGLGGIRDLPVPTWLFSWGAAVVLVLSFLLLGTLWKRPLLEAAGRGRELPAGLERFLGARALHLVVGALSAGLLVLVFLTALIGEPASGVNLAPTFVYVLFWLGVVALQVLLGNVWPALNPWLAIANGVAFVWGLLGRDWKPPLALPARWGVYPAVVALFAFAALELCYPDPASPRKLALAIAIYSYAMWFGMAAVGRREWAERGDGFTVYFGLLARIAPLGRNGEGRLVARWPFSGLASPDRRPGLLAFVAVMLGSVGFDGFSRSSAWQNLRARVEGPFVLDSPAIADLVTTLLQLGGLLAAVAVVVLAYRAAIRLAESMVGREPPLAAEFVQSLIPIALVYAVAHYFTLFLIQGQFAIPMLSDPFGYGWDVFGTLDYSPNLTPISPNAVWYVQVGTLVVGHVAGLAVAHDRAISLLPGRAGLRSQYALLVLMVAYTVLGLWLLSQD